MKYIRNVKEVVVTISPNNDVHVSTTENGTIVSIDQVKCVRIDDQRTDLAHEGESNAEYIARSRLMHDEGVVAKPIVADEHGHASVPTLEEDTDAD